MEKLIRSTDDIKTGDLVLFKSEGFLGNLMKLIDMPVMHVGIVYDIAVDSETVKYTKSGKVDQRSGKKKMRVMEATYNGMEMNLYDWNDDDIVIMRYNGEYDEMELRRVLWAYYSELSQAGNMGYSFRGFLDAAINGLLEYSTFGLWRKRRLLGDDVKEFCAEFVIEAFERHVGSGTLYKETKGIFGFKFHKKDVVSPTDILLNKDFTILKDMKLSNYEYPTLFGLIYAVKVLGKKVNDQEIVQF